MKERRGFVRRGLLKRIGAVTVAMCLTVSSVSLPSFMVKAEQKIQDNVLKSWSFDTDVQGWEYASGWEYEYSGVDNTSVAFDNEMLKVDVDYSKDADKGYSKMVIKHWESGMTLQGLSKVEWDLYFNPSSMTKGSFSMELYTDAGTASASLDMDNAEVINDDLHKLHVSMNFDEPIAEETLNQVAIQIIGANTDFKGSLWFDNMVLSGASKSEGGYDETVLKSWPFDANEEGWEYGGKDWIWDYDGNDNSSTSFDSGKLKVTVDYSKNVDKSWSQLAIKHYEEGMQLNGLNNVELDFYYDTSSMTMGNFSLKIYTGDGDATTSLDLSEGEIVEGSLHKLHVVIPFAEPIKASTLDQIAIQIIGVYTDYKGSLLFDNIVLSNKTAKEDSYVDSTVQVTGGANQVSIENGNLITTNKNGEQETTVLATDISLVDKDASSSVRQIYSYLKAMGDTDSVLFGHQNDTHHKAGSKSLSESDTYDITGSYSGVIGMDTLSLTGNEYSAKRYNTEIASGSGIEAIPETAAGNVQAAAALTNKNIEEGAIITLSCHMPNFSIVNEETENYDGVNTYSRYDFKGYSPNNLTGDVMNQILPGGQYNEVYTAYLDMIADYASQVNGAILFRPFHENTGSWFWWGAAFCDAQTYKNVYRYTVEYLRDDKNIHNLIYVYGPGSEAATLEEYEVRYPGDAYVDMVGFDMYDQDPTAEGKWFTQFKKQLELVNQFAQKHNKLFAVTEVGVSTSTPDKGDNQTALHKTGNADLEWYQKLQEAVSESDASYFLVWANFGLHDGYYTPFVDSINDDGTLHGHEMLDKFIEYYNDNRSIFSGNQKQAIEDMNKVTINTSPLTTEATGYITAPVSGSRILEPVTMTARVNNVSADTKVQFVVKGNQTITVIATSTDGKFYTAKLDKSTLDKLGESNGVLQLQLNGKIVDEIALIFNIEPPVEDPYLIDGFENYYGLDTLLNKKWTTNKASGSNIKLSLDSNNLTHNLGDYSMKFTYTETSGGWAGATLGKTVDWSTCNALQFYTIPDGNNQKVVVQITANGTVYEVYLNLYEGYRDKTQPMLVTIPFEEFCKRDVAGNPKGGLIEDAGNVTSFGLWVNAIDNSEAMKEGSVSGTIYYDTITAIKSNVTKPEFKLIEDSNPSVPSNPSTGGGIVDGGKDDTVSNTSAMEIIINTQKDNKNQKLQELIQELLGKDKPLQYTVVNVKGTYTVANKVVKVNVATTNGVKSGDKVYIYAYNSETGNLENMNKTTYTVDQDGNVDFIAYHDQSYVILQQKVKGSKVVSRAKQSIVETTCTVEKGEKVYLLPIIKKEYKAKVTYKSSNKKVVTISKSGAVTGKKVGTATITTYIKIGKVTASYKTKVTVTK